MRCGPVLICEVEWGVWHKHTMKARNINFLSDALVNTSRTSFICLFLLLPRDLFPFSEWSHLHFQLFFPLFIWKMHKSAAVDGKPERSLLLDANHQRRCIRLIWRTNYLKALQNVLKPTLMRWMSGYFWEEGAEEGGTCSAIDLHCPLLLRNIPALAIWRVFMHLFIIFMHCSKALLLIEHLEIDNMIDVLNGIQSHLSQFSRMLYALL